MLTRLLVRVLAVTVVMSVLAACGGGRGEPEAPQLGVVSVGPRRLSVTQPPGHIRVRSVRTPPPAPACLPTDFGFTEAVVSAALEPLDAVTLTPAQTNRIAAYLG